MTNRLTEIREAAVEVLKRKFRRVYSGRGFAPVQADLPCVAVYIDTRRSEAETLDSPTVYRHTARLVTLVCVRGNADAEALAEEMLSVIGQAFAQSPDLDMGGNAPESLYPDLLNIETDGDGEAVTVYYQQGWQAVYFDTAV